jgi:hypothetical protein
MGLDLLTRLAVVRRQMASVAVLVAPVDAGFVGARALRDDQPVASPSSVPVLGAAEIPERLAQGSLLGDGRRLLTIGTGGSRVTPGEFPMRAARWLAPGGFPAVAWVERVPMSDRAAYERRLGRPVAREDREGKAAVVGAPTSGPRARIGYAVAPMLVRGPVLGAKCGIRAALARCGRLWAASTPLTPRAAGAGPLGLRFAGG